MGFKLPFWIFFFFFVFKDKNIFMGLYNFLLKKKKDREGMREFERKM